MGKRGVTCEYPPGVKNSRGRLGYFGVLESSRMDDQPFVYTRREAATLLRISQNTLDRVIRRGEIRTRRIGSRVVISRKALLEFLQDAQRGAGLELTLYTRREAAALLKISPKTLDRVIRRGEIRTRRIGSRSVILRKALLEFLQDAQKRGAGQQ
jgi:excisionase family DNA binding protein